MSLMFVADTTSAEFVAEFAAEFVAEFAAEFATLEHLPQQE